MYGEHEQDRSVARTELDHRLVVRGLGLQPRPVAAQHMERRPGGRRSASLRRGGSGSGSLAPLTKPGDHQLRLDSAGRRIDQQSRLQRDDLGATRDVDHAEHALRLRVAHGGRGARPRMHEPVVVLRAADLHRLPEREGRSRRARADGVLRPVGPGHETHAVGERAQLAVALDPQQATGLVADRDDHSRVLCLTRQQQRTDHVHHRGERMCETVGVELVADQVERRSALRADPPAPGPLPRLTDEGSHLLQTPIVEVSGEQFLVRTLDEKSRCRGKGLAGYLPRRRHSGLRSSRACVASVYEEHCPGGNTSPCQRRSPATRSSITSSVEVSGSIGVVSLSSSNPSIA